MNRRGVLKGGAAFGIVYALGFSARAIDWAWDLPPPRPLVWDLAPDAPIPDSYEDVLTAGEKIDRLRFCAQKHVACYPILEGEIARTRRPFRSWSLFLISNPGWLSPSGTDQIALLYEAYTGFARAIGKDHAAVFFWKKQPESSGGKLVGADLAAQLDASRCAEYSTAFKLDISQSPHVIVTTQLPSPNTGLGHSLVLQLGGLQPSSAQQLLTLLAAQLVKERLDQAELDSERWWLTWKDVATTVFETLKPILKNSKATIKAGPVELEIKGEK